MSQNYLQCNGLRLKNDLHRGYTFAMEGRNAPHVTTAMTADQLSAIAEQLQIWVNELRLAEQVTRRMEGATLAVHAVKSSAKGMHIFGAFMKALEESRIASMTGRPFVVGQHKPRYDPSKSIAAAKTNIKKSRSKKAPKK